MSAGDQRIWQRRSLLPSSISCALLPSYQSLLTYIHHHPILPCLHIFSLLLIASEFMSELQDLQKAAPLTLQAVCLPRYLPLVLHQDFKGLPLPFLPLFIGLRLSFPLCLPSRPCAHHLPALQLRPLDHGLTPDSLIDTLGSLTLPCEVLGHLLSIAK